jgi:hypothetical protein
MKLARSKSRIINEMNTIMKGLYDARIISEQELTDFQQLPKTKKAPLNQWVLPSKGKNSL